MSRLPAWFKQEVPEDPQYQKVKTLLEELSLNTVCKEAKCPNVGECYSRGTATFMVLGDVCTRNCRFCAIALGKPRKVDPEEPERLKQAVDHLGLRHVVVTMVTRDDLPDGGAAHIAEVVRKVHELQGPTIEVLTSDFRGQKDSVQTVIDSQPEIFNHNLETVERLHKPVRPMMRYDRSLEVLQMAKAMNGSVITKSSMMLGLGEQEQEVQQAIEDLKAVNCDVLTLGQYLRPPDSALKVQRYLRPEEFEAYADFAKSLGFLQVVSGPLVRSSYRADEALFLHNS